MSVNHAGNARPRCLPRGKSSSAVAGELGVARLTAVNWQARYRAGGAAALHYRIGRRPAIPDSELPVIDQALRKGPAAHGLHGEVWTTTQVAEVIRRADQSAADPQPVKRLLAHRLGWSVQHPQLPATGHGQTEAPERPSVAEGEASLLAAGGDSDGGVDELVGGQVLGAEVGG